MYPEEEQHPADGEAEEAGIPEIPEDDEDRPKAT